MSNLRIYFTDNNKVEVNVFEWRLKPRMIDIWRDNSDYVFVTTETAEKYGYHEAWDWKKVSGYDDKRPVYQVPRTKKYLRTVQWMCFSIEFKVKLKTEAFCIPKNTDDRFAK